MDDVVEAFLLAAASEAANGQVFNVGSGAATSLREAAELAVEIAGSGSIADKPFPADKQKIEIGNYCADITKIRRALGWAPRTPLREGVRRTVEFFRRHRLQYWDAEK